MEARLAEICPHWDWFRTVAVEFSWPCAPKAFRYLEKLLWCIGRERPAIDLPSFPLADPEEVPGFLQCEDTYPNHDQAGAWWREFIAALDGWWQEKPERSMVADDVNERLGESTPLKRWLVRLFLRKLRMLESNKEQFTSLVDPKHGHRRGTRAV
jgi:hypothetical protein